ncbi:PLP-dependent aminotransferase family protein, partial [Streptomyces sp. NPDC054841]
RVLAADLRISRGVVTEAYQRLTDDGHVAGRGRAGTIVVAAPGLSGAPAPGAGTAPAAAAVSTAEPPAPGPGLFTARPGPDIFEGVAQGAP